MNLALATWVSAINFWAWNMIGPLSTTYAGDMKLSSTEASMLVATPILVGSLGRIVVGSLTDRFGGRAMFIAVSLASIGPVLAVGAAGSARSYPLLLVFGFFLGVAGTIFAVGIPFANNWYEAARRGFATGVFGMGMVGTALSAFFTPRFVRWFGLFATHVIVAGSGVALRGPITGSAAVVQPSVQCLSRASVGGVSERHGVGFARGAGDRGETGFGGELVKTGGAFEDRPDLTDDLGQVKGADARQIGQQPRVGVCGDLLGDHGVERIDAGLQRTRDCNLATDHLRHNWLAEPTGRYRGATKTVQEFGAATAAAVAAAAAERLNPGRRETGGGPRCRVAVEEVQPDRRMQLGKNGFPARPVLVQQCRQLADRGDAQR